MFFCRQLHVLLLSMVAAAAAAAVLERLSTAYFFLANDREGHVT